MEHGVSQKFYHVLNTFDFELYRSIHKTFSKSLMSGEPFMKFVAIRSVGMSMGYVFLALELRLSCTNPSIFSRVA